MRSKASSRVGLFAGGSLLLVLASATGQQPQVSLYADSGQNNICEQATPPSEQWVIHNLTNHPVTAILTRFFEQDLRQTVDHPQIPLRANETKSLGCHTWIGGKQNYQVDSVK